MVVTHSVRAQMPLEPYGAELCPMFAAAAGTADAVHPAPTSTCPAPAAMRSWKRLKFGELCAMRPVQQGVWSVERRKNGRDWAKAVRK